MAGVEHARKGGVHASEEIDGIHVRITMRFPHH
jgi:hypothetical protein